MSIFLPSQRLHGGSASDFSGCDLTSGASGASNSTVRSPRAYSMMAHASHSTKRVENATRSSWNRLLACEIRTRPASKSASCSERSSRARVDRSASNGVRATFAARASLRLKSRRTSCIARLKSCARSEIAIDVFNQDEQDLFQMSVAFPKTIRTTSQLGVVNH